MAWLLSSSVQRAMERGSETEEADGDEVLGRGNINLSGVCICCELSMLGAQVSAVMRTENKKDRSNV